MVSPYPYFSSLFPFRPFLHLHDHLCMRPRIRSNTKTLDIRLFDEKFYFPGETIKGTQHIG